MIKAVIFDWGRTLYDSDTGSLSLAITPLARGPRGQRLSLHARTRAGAGPRQRGTVADERQPQPTTVRAVFHRPPAPDRSLAPPFLD